MKILVACPTYDGKKYALREWIKAAKKLQVNGHEVNFLLVDNSQTDEYTKELELTGVEVIKSDWNENPKKRVVDARNLIRDICIEREYDYLFSLEQDVIPESNTLLKLLSHNKAIVSGVVYNNLEFGNKIKSLPMIYVPHPKDATGLFYITEDKLQGDQLILVKGVSLSCIIIHRLVLEKIKFRYYEKTWDDLPFSEDAIKTGFDIYVDTSVKPKHLHE